MQGKAELVADLPELLQAFYREKLDALLAHEAGSRRIEQYDFNNTYQYIVNREETQLTWLSTAIVELGAAVPESGATPSAREGSKTSKDPHAWRAVVEEDARNAQAFVDRWRPRVEAMTNARHQGMLRVILGETLEQKRFFEQALAGQTDLLGTRGPEVGARVGHVLATRWIE